jgi:hypothetical protein
VYPPRNLISVTSLTLTDSIQIYRSVGGERTLVRAATSDSVTDPSFVRVDAEFPFGVPVTYVAVINSSTEISAGPVTYSLVGGKPVFTDAISGNAAEVVIRAWDQKSWSRRASVFKVGNRNVVVSSGSLGMYEAAIEVYVSAGSSAANFFETITAPTEGIVQIRNASGSINDYVVVLSANEVRFEHSIEDEQRLFLVNVAEVEAWASALEARAYTLQDIADYYGVSGTLQDIADDYTDLLSIAQGDFS